MIDISNKWDGAEQRHDMIWDCPKMINATSSHRIHLHLYLCAWVPTYGHVDRNLFQPTKSFSRDMRISAKTWWWSWCWSGSGYWSKRSTTPTKWILLWIHFEWAFWAIGPRSTSFWRQSWESCPQPEATSRRGWEKIFDICWHSSPVFQTLFEIETCFHGMLLDRKLHIRKKYTLLCWSNHPTQPNPSLHSSSYM